MSTHERIVGVVAGLWDQNDGVFPRPIILEFRVDGLLCWRVASIVEDVRGSYQHGVRCIPPNLPHESSYRARRPALSLPAPQGPSSSRRTKNRRVCADDFDRDGGQSSCIVNDSGLEKSGHDDSSMSLLWCATNMRPVLAHELETRSLRLVTASTWEGSEGNITLR